LNFKIILIQKSQISIFRKVLNLFEFENVFDLNLNLSFKFKSAAKIFQKHFHFLLAAQNSFWPTTPCSPLGPAPAQTCFVSLLCQITAAGRRSRRRLASPAAPPRCSSAGSPPTLLKKPPLHLADSPFPLPISSPAQNGAINGRRPSFHTNRLHSLASGPIKGTHTFSALHRAIPLSSLVSSLLVHHP
jgi:hypothetical protein